MALKDNIFQNREGAIYKDLACLTHEDRINYLQRLITIAMGDYFRLKGNDYKRMSKAQLGLVQFYLRLIKVCENNKETCNHDMCHIENHHPSINKICQCEKCENSLFEKEIERNPIDFKMEIEQVFEPEDCTMVMEDYGKCQDYPCDDCTKRFLNSRCKNCWEEEKAKDNTWDMCKSCANEVHKELGTQPW